MMQIVCNLEDFFITRLQVDALDCNPSAEAQAARVTFDYDLAAAVGDENRIKMEMTFSLAPNLDEEESTCPYAIEASMTGYFVFPQDLEDQQIAYLCRVNTLSILYGILRGEVAGITGSFPHGKFVLPTVMMQDVVTNIEQRKQQAEDGGE